MNKPRLIAASVATLALAIGALVPGVAVASASGANHIQAEISFAHVDNPG